MAANPEPSDLRFAGLVRRVRTRGTRLVMVGLDRPDSLGVLASLRICWTASRTSN
jgi:UDP-N-acetylglucosamine 2-epimerase (non-hydrolysing)